MNRVEGPWCWLDYENTNVKMGLWRAINTKGFAQAFACNNFWSDFEWEPPTRGQELRFIGSNELVRGAQKTLIRNDYYGRIITLKPFDLGMYPPMLRLLLRIEPRKLYEFYVWWWPEYRDGVTKL